MQNGTLKNRLCKEKITTYSSLPFYYIIRIVTFMCNYQSVKILSIKVDEYTADHLALSKVKLNWTPQNQRPTKPSYKPQIPSLQRVISSTSVERKQLPNHRPKIEASPKSGVKFKELTKHDKAIHYQIYYSSEQQKYLERHSLDLPKQ